MGINVGNVGNGVLNLEKNQVLNLTKKNPGLKEVDLGAGWDMTRSGADADLDIVGIMLDANGRCTNVSKFIYFNNKVASGIRLHEDNRTGAGDGDDEIISLDLSKISPDVHKIVFAVVIYQARERRQTFGMIDNSYVRLMNKANGGKELCRFNLKTDGSTGTAVIFSELYRDGVEWDYKAIGESKVTDINGLLAMYS